MKNKQLILAFLVLVFVTSSCLKKPEASITLSKTTAAINEEITATSTTTDANDYTWFFYEGVKTSVQAGSGTPHVIIVSEWQYGCDVTTITFKFDSVGTYTVFLKACNWKGGCPPSDNGTSGFCDEAYETVTIQ